MVMPGERGDPGRNRRASPLAGHDLLLQWGLRVVLTEGVEMTTSAAVAGWSAGLDAVVERIAAQSGLHDGAVQATPDAVVERIAAQSTRGRCPCPRSGTSSPP